MNVKRTLHHGGRGKARLARAACLGEASRSRWFKFKGPPRPRATWEFPLQFKRKNQGGQGTSTSTSTQTKTNALTAHTLENIGQA
jgi:hypothetical protein